MERYYTDQTDLEYLKTPAAAAAVSSTPARPAVVQVRPLEAGSGRTLEKAHARIRDLETELSLSRSECQLLRERNEQLARLAAWGGGRRVETRTRDEH